MENKAHLLNKSKQMFAKGSELEATDPKAALDCRILGHTLRASYLMANESDNYIQDLEKSASLKLEQIDRFNTILGPSQQVGVVFLSLATTW